MRMRPVPRAAELLLLCFALHAQETTFRVDVNLVRVLATVKDAEGRLVGSLEKKDFTLLDNGAPQQIALFERHQYVLRIDGDQGAGDWQRLVVTMLAAQK